MFLDLLLQEVFVKSILAIILISKKKKGAYIPGMADYSIFVKNQAQVYLGGPPLVKMAIGEIVDDETLGGAEMHSKISGVSDYLAQDERHAIRLAREIVRNLNYKKKTPLPLSHFSQIEEPLYDPGWNPLSNS